MQKHSRELIMSRNVKYCCVYLKKCMHFLPCHWCVFCVTLYDFCMSPVLLLMDDVNLPDEKEKKPVGLIWHHMRVILTDVCCPVHSGYLFAWLLRYITLFMRQCGHADQNQKLRCPNALTYSPFILQVLGMRIHKVSLTVAWGLGLKWFVFWAMHKYIWLDLIS